MRELTLEHDREWIVLVITRTRGGERKSRRVYFSPDEAAVAVFLLVRELPDLTVSKTDGPAS